MLTHRTNNIYLLYSYSRYIDDCNFNYSNEVEWHVDA